MAPTNTPAPTSTPAPGVPTNTPVPAAPTPTPPPAQTLGTCCICGSNGLRPAGSSSDCSSSAPQCAWNSTGPCWDSRANNPYACSGFGDCTGGGGTSTQPWSGSGSCTIDGKSFSVTGSSGVSYAKNKSNGQFIWQGENVPFTHSVPSGTAFDWYVNDQYQGTATCNTVITQCYVCDSCVYRVNPVQGTSCPAGVCDPRYAQDQCSSSIDLSGQACGTSLQSCVPTPTPTPTLPPIPPSSPSITNNFVCIADFYYVGNGVVISWTTPPGYPVQQVEISDDMGFSTTYIKGASVSATSTTAPEGFSTTDGTLFVAATNQIYYVRLRNSVGVSPLKTFVINKCASTVTPPVTPTAAPVLTVNAACTSASPYRIQLNWADSSVSWVDLSTDPNFSTYSHKNVQGTLSTIAPDGFNAAQTGWPTINTFSVGVPYYIRLWNGYFHSNYIEVNYTLCPAALTPTPTPTPPYRPWLKTVGGDVHSNQ